MPAARDTLNGLLPALEMVFLVGDYFHDYPSPDLDFYFKQTTRIDHAKSLTDGLHRCRPRRVRFRSASKWTSKTSVCRTVRLRINIRVIDADDKPGSGK